ncbi:CocE/NonD family hydrolase [Phenylobacterium aquaticum]|uniref:CocE/NonD family hydrolase n=1 Tax=Phenylobacterium aquaticum TaxID=1763816 RepID=UPI0026EB5B38|nr:CocE/NonD family hydrolase [Phenylobacterium aquaticum]
MKPSRRVLLAAAAAPAFAGLAAPATAAGWSLPPEGGVTETEHVWIPMPDGVRLSARLFVPDTASARPVPAVLEYIPYRKRDGYRGHDSAWGHQLASRGFAYVRVDVRGSGDSEGVQVDEYDVPELDDGVAIIDWIARQSWCSGAVGMRGISWGGINTLQVASRRPKALKAIMALGTTDTRYGNDAHYVGGALGHTNLQWGIDFKGVMAGPPDPAVVGPAWETMWRQRLAATPPIMETWLRHQTNDAYWKRGSLDQDWGAIQVPTYVVSGWQDSYSNPVGRILTHLKVPKKGLIGPWGHTYPWTAAPMSLDWAVEEVRWWTQWLKGVDTGIMAEPMLRAFMPYATWAESRPQEIPGRWVAEPTWPSPAIALRVFHLAPGGLAAKPGPAHTATYVGDRVVGLTKPEWIDRPPIDQALDDARSLTFDSAPLTDDLEILGYPTFKVRIGADVPVAKLAVRLTEVTADGRSWLVTYGLKNLTHRQSDSDPAPLEPGKLYDVEFPLFMTGYRFRKGSRIRVAISENLWPLAWPSPRIATLSLALEHSRLSLPVRPQESAPAPFPIPIRHAAADTASPAPAVTTAPVSPGHYRIELNTPPAPFTWPDIKTTTARGHWETVELTEGQPNSGFWRQQATSAWTRDAWDCEVTATIELKSTETEFLLTESLTARQAGQVIFERSEDTRITRNLV